MYCDKRACDRELSVGDRVYVSAVDRLRGLESCRWPPGRVLSCSGVQFTIELSDGGIIVRHADQVRRRYCDDLVPEIPNSAIPLSRAAPVTPLPVPVPVPSPASPAAPSTVTPVPSIPVVEEPSSSGPQSPPASELREQPDSVSAGAAAPARDPSEPHRYNLRNRANLRPPDRY